MEETKKFTFEIILKGYNNSLRATIGNEEGIESRVIKGILLLINKKNDKSQKKLLKYVLPHNIFIFEKLKKNL